MNNDLAWESSFAEWCRQDGRFGVDLELQRQALEVFLDSFNRGEITSLDGVGSAMSEAIKEANFVRNLEPSRERSENQKPPTPQPQKGEVHSIKDGKKVVQMFGTVWINDPRGAGDAADGHRPDTQQGRKEVNEAAVHGTTV